MDADSDTSIRQAHAYGDSLVSTGTGTGTGRVRVGRIIRRLARGLSFGTVALRLATVESMYEDGATSNRLGVTVTVTVKVTRYLL